MIAAPSANGSNGRTSAGRFAKGNAGGPGNPHSKRVSELRSALLSKIKPEDIEAIVTGLVDKARTGDIHAAREVLDRALGKSNQTLQLDATVDVAVDDGPKSPYDDHVRAINMYASMCVPKRAWLPGFLLQYNAWLDGNAKGTRPENWDEIVQKVEANCNWLRVTPEAAGNWKLATAHKVFDGENMKYDETKIELHWGAA